MDFTVSVHRGCERFRVCATMRCKRGGAWSGAGARRSGCDALAKPPDRGHIWRQRCAHDLALAALRTQDLADRVRTITALSRAFLRNRRADVDTVHASATCGVFELLSAAFGVV